MSEARFSDSETISLNQSGDQSTPQSGVSTAQGSIAPPREIDRDESDMAREKEDEITPLNEETQIVRPSSESQLGLVQAGQIARRVQGNEIISLNEETRIVVPNNESQLGLVQGGQIAQRVQEVVVAGGDFHGSNFGKQDITHVTEDYSNATIIEHATIIKHYHGAAEGAEGSSSNASARQQKTKNASKEQEEKDVKDFLHKVTENTKEKIKFDVRGKRKNLFKLNKHTQPKLMVIKMEGMQSSPDDAGTANSGKQRQTGTDVAEIKIQDIHEEMGSFHVLLIGDAGEGKSSTAKYYAMLFLPGGELAQGKIKLVLYIRFSDIDTQKTTPFDLLITKQVGKLDARLKAAGQNLLQSNPEEVLLILDGMDESKFAFEKSYPLTDHEASTDPATIIANIVSGHIYRGMKILSTSRWHTFWSLGDNFKPDRIVALRGFSHGQVKEIFKQLLGSNADGILKHLEEKASGLLSLCSTPNILLNTASVLSQSLDVRPETETAIMVHIIKHLLTSENTHNKDEDLVVYLSELAYYGLENDILTFTSMDLKSHNLEMSRLHDFTNTDAILIPDQCGVQERDKRCSFYHKTIQEVFAVLYICFNIIKFQNRLGDILWDPKMEKVCVFLFGILAHESTAKIVQNHILHVKIPCDHMRKILQDILASKLKDGVIGDVRVCRVLQECDQRFIEKFSGSVNEIKMPYTTLEPRDSYIVSSAASKLGHLKTVHILNLELNPTTVTLLAENIDSIEQFVVAEYIGELVLSDELQEKHKPDVQKVLNKIKFSKIGLNCTDDIARFFLMNCNEKKVKISTKHNKKLQISTYKLIAAATPRALNLADNNLTDNHVEQLLVGARESQTDKPTAPSKLFLPMQDELDISGNKNIGTGGFRSVIKYATKFRQLSIKNCNLNGEKFEAILNEAQQEKELRLMCLDIDENKDIEPEGFRPLVDFAKEVCLEFLWMRDCNLNGESFRAMANQVEGKELELKHVFIDKNRNVKPEGYKHLVDFLKHTRVADLYMEDCKLTTAKLRAMTNQLKARDVKIPGLSLGKNIPSDSGYIHQSLELIVAADGEDIDMSDCNLTSEQMELFCTGLARRNIVLCNIDLSQDLPNPTKELLSCVCQLFHCVRNWIDLHKWKFSEDDLVILKAELQKGPFKNLEVYVDHPSGYARFQKTGNDDLADQQPEASPEPTADPQITEAEGSGAVSDLPSQEIDEITIPSKDTPSTSKQKSKSGVRSLFKKIFRR